MQNSNTSETSWGGEVAPIKRRNPHRGQVGRASESTHNSAADKVNYTIFKDLRDPQGQKFTTDWAGFCRLIKDAPTYPAKDQQPLVKLATFEQDSRAGGCALLDIHGVELDYDAGQAQPQEAADLLQAAGIRAIVCSTYTSKPDFPKWRVFAPTSKPYEARHRAALVAAMDAVIGNIAARESYTPKQTFFIGRSTASGYTVIVTGGQCFDTLPACQQTAREYQTCVAREAAEREAAAIRAAEIRINRRNRFEANGMMDGQVSVIQSFNDAHDVAAILTRHGYKPDRAGKRFLCPASTSGLHGVVLLDDGLKCFSHHSNDPLADGKAHDAFDVFAILAHGGDDVAAIKAAGALLYMGSESLSQFNHKVYRKVKLQQRVAQAWGITA